MDSAPHPATTQSSADASARPMNGELGFVAASRYAIVGEVGHGGMGRIYEAHDVALGRTVALKMPREGAEEHLRHEALVTARLQHPGIVPVYEAGRLTSGQIFYAMRLVKGRRLDEVIAGAASISERLALVRHFVAVAEAVAYAHGEGVVHRDLKPHNVLVGALGEVVVIDWGLAHDLRGARAAPPIAGTPAYMSPEQARGEPVSLRDDVFALGAMLYHLLSGAVPRRGVLDPATPPDLVAVVDKAMAVDPDARYPDARALATDLVRFETGQLVGAYRYSGGELFKRWLRRHRALVALGAVSFVVLALVGVMSIVRIADERDSAELARGEAERSRDALLLAQARSWLPRDATTAFAWLRAYADGVNADTSEVHATLAEISALGVARHVFRGMKSVSASPDGRRAILIDAEHERRLAVLDVASGRVVPQSAPDDDARGFVWSKDGALVAALSEKRIRVFRSGDFLTETGPAFPAPMATLPLDVPARCASFLRDDGALVIGLASGGLQIIPIDGSDRRTFVGHSGSVRAVEVAPDGRHLLTTGMDGTARLWVLATGESEVLPESKTRGGAYAVLSDSGTSEARVAWVGADAKVRWRALGGGAVTELVGHEKPAAVVAFSPDGKQLASGGFDHTVRIWDLATGQARVLEAHPNVVTRVMFSPDGRRLMSASLDRDVLVWNLDTLDFQRLDGHPDVLTSGAFAADGETILIGDGDTRLRVWNLQVADSMVLRGHTSSSLAAMMVDDDHAFTISDDGSARLWDLARGTTRVHPTPVQQLGGWNASPDGRQVAAGGVDASVWVMDTASGVARVLGRHAAMVHAIAFAPDGKQLASGSADRTIKLWDLSSGVERTLTGHESAVWSLAYSPDGKQLASGSDDKIARVHDLATGARTDLVGHERRVTWLVVLADGRVVTSSADMTLRLWDPAGGAQVWTGHEAIVTMIAASPDGRTVASASDDRSARLWDVATGASTVLAHDAIVIAVVFTPDGRRVITGTNDGAVRVWDRATGDLLLVRRDHTLSLASLTVSPNGRRLVTTSEDMTLRICAMPPDVRAVDSLDALSTVRLEQPRGATDPTHFDARPVTPR